MSHRLLETLQGRILARVAREGEDEVTDREIAGILGCCRSLVSKIRSGDRELSISGLAALVRRFGAVAVLQPLAELDGCRVVPIETAPAPDPVGQSLETADLSLAYTRALRAAARDRVITSEELEGLLDLKERLINSAGSSVPRVGTIN